MVSMEEWEKESERTFFMEKAIVEALAGGASDTTEIVQVAHETLLKKNYQEVSLLLLRLTLLRLLQRNEYIKKESATAYAITPEGREYLKSPHSVDELGANYVRNLIYKARK